MIYRSKVKITEEEILAELRPYWVKGNHLWLPEQGWWDLVIETHRAIVAIAPDYEISQIKEKFGGLRYYIDGVDYGSEVGPVVRKIIEGAELDSMTLCTRCGRQGKLWNKRYWTYTLCNYHIFKEWKRNWSHRQEYRLKKLMKKSKK